MLWVKVGKNLAENWKVHGRSVVMYLSATQTQLKTTEFHFSDKDGRDGRRIPRQLACPDRDYGRERPRLCFFHKLPGIASRARSTIYDLALTRPVINGFRAQLRDAFSSKAITSIANDLFPFSGWKFSFALCALRYKHLHSAWPLKRWKTRFYRP